MKTVGNYEIVRMISEGSFGRTFYGRHRRLGKPVCIKQEKTGDPIFMDLFRKEAALLWDIKHESLPTVKEYYELPDFGQLIVMSFIEGDSLQDLVERDGFIDDEHICWILQRLLEAVSYLHYHKVIHCDIKPQNIILNIAEHNAVLVDFGLCVVDPGAKTLAKGGTQYYIPPEFEKRFTPIPPSDLYSLGMTAVFMAGGNIRTGGLPSDMRPELIAFIQKMIRRDPLARPQDARRLNMELTKLRRALFGRSSSKEIFKHRS